MDSSTLDAELNPSDNLAMFFRSVKVTSSSGTVHEYVRLVEAVRENGHARQKVIANLGRRDVLEPLLPALVRFLKGEDVLTDRGSVDPIESLTWGPVLVVREIFQQLGLWKILDGCRQGPGRDPLFADRVLALVANRLSYPTSEHGLARWLETDFVCDREGRRFEPKWRERQRVKVEFGQLQSWYRTLDRLIANKESIETSLYGQLRDLFSLEPDLVFYDLTSTYFEGHGPAGFARHGYSRDRRPRNPQVLVGVVMVNGWPICHHVLEGNLRDSTTVADVLDDLCERWQFRRIIFVGDRGMVTATNLKGMKAKNYHHLVGLNRRRRPEIQVLIDRTTDEWLPCPGGINAQEKGKNALPTRVQEVSSDQEGTRVFVVESEERRIYEVAMRERAMERTRAPLEKLLARVEAGGIKKPEKIGAAATKILQRNHGYRYYAWELEDGKFRFFEHPVNLAREKKYEGKYLIQTDEPDITPQEAVRAYKELNEVERGFRTLKDPLGMRPIYHRSENRVRAHIFVAALAFLVDRFVEKKLKQAKVNLSSTEAMKAVETIRWVRFRIQDDTRDGVTPGSGRARQVLRALDITDRRPSKPPRGRQTPM